MVDIEYVGNGTQRRWLSTIGGVADFNFNAVVCFSRQSRLFGFLKTK